MKNTSQDPDYEGPTGYEKRIHKNHFAGIKKTWRGAPAEWVEIAPGRYRLVSKKARKARRKAEET